MLEKIDNKKNMMIKILTIASYIVSIFMYELFICNGVRNNDGFNFSLCRYIMYGIFLVLVIFFLDKYILEAVKTFEKKPKKVVFIGYCIISIMLIIYIALRWTSMYKATLFIIALLMGALFIFYVSTNFVKNVTVAICTVGMMFTVTTSFQHGLDEKKHAMSAINLAYGNFDYAKNPLNEPAFNNIIFNCNVTQYSKFFAEKYEPGLTEDWGNTKDEKLYYISSSPADYNFILYIPSAIGMKIAITLGGSIADVYIMGRLFNLIAYGILVALALKILPSKQKIFSIIYLLPMPLLLAASYSIDGICIGFIGIFIAYCLRLAKDYTQIKLKQMFILLVLFVLCLLAKNLAYFAIAVFVLIIPIIKTLKNNKDKLSVIIATILVLVMACAGLLLYKLNSSVINGEADARGGDTDGKAQLEFLIENPTNIVKVVFKHLMGSLLDFDWYAELNQQEFFGIYYKQIFLLEFIFLIYVAITDDSEQLNTRTKLVSVLTFFAVYLSTSLMLYITFTPVGTIGINGYQTRYIVPILPLVLMIINRKDNKYKNNDVIIYMISGMFILIDLLCAIYKIA